jgi:hypothetical protein
MKPPKITTVRVGQGGWMKTEDFLLEDYKLKVEYYTGHLSRMWTRFNFFLTIEAALLGLASRELTRSTCHPLLLIGILLRVLWGVLGGLDLLYIRIYHRHLQSAYSLLKKETSGLPPGYPYAGSTEESKLLRHGSPKYVAVLLPAGVFLGLCLWLILQCVGRG